MSMKTVRRRTEYWMVNGNRLHNYKYSICARIFFFFFSMLFLCFRFSCSWFSLYCIFLINRFNCVNCGDYKNIRIMHHQREKLSSNRFKCIINFFFFWHLRIILYRYSALIHQKNEIVPTTITKREWQLEYWFFIF